MRISGITRVLGVIGWPVDHSLSPLMHNAELERMGLEYVYVAWPVAPENLADAARGFVAAGVKGFNATIPHKQALLPLMDEVSEEVKAVGAVNTVIIREGRLIGHNTDAQGWLDDVRQDILLSGLTIGVLGAGGAARAIAAASAIGEAARIVIFNRTEANAVALIDAVKPYYPAATFEKADLTSGDSRDLFVRCDVIVNTTSVGMNSQPGIPVPAEWLHKDQYVYDTIYTPARTVLLQTAEEVGCPVRNGMGMLARQGALAFELWTGEQPDVGRMENVLKNALSWQE